MTDKDTKPSDTPAESGAGTGPAAPKPTIDLKADPVPEAPASGGDTGPSATPSTPVNDPRSEGLQATEFPSTQAGGAGGAAGGTGSGGTGSGGAGSGGTGAGGTGPSAPPPEPEDPRISGIWLRLVFMIAFGALSWLVFCLTLFLALLQFVVAVVNKELNEDLQVFSRRLVAYLADLLGYVTFQSEDKPFPLGRFPQDKDGL